MRRPHRLLLIACATVLVLAVGGLSAFALAGRSPRTVAVRLSGTGTHVVPVALVDTPRGFAVQPNRITVDPGTPLVLDVVNQADEHHDLAVDGGTTRTRMLDPGQSRRLDLGRVTRDVSAWCTLPGHKTFGMTLDIRVALLSPSTHLTQPTDD